MKNFNCHLECEQNEKENKKALFEQVTKPLIKYLAENHHPHVVVVVDSTHAELFEGKMIISTDEYIVD